MFIRGDELKRKNLLLKAKLAQEAKRYDHMVFFMKEIVQATDPSRDISPKERCLLGAAFKNFIAQPRDSLRFAKATTRTWLDSFRAPLAASFLLKSQTEVATACAEIIELIDRRLFPSASSKESKLHYLTLKGDFSWYLAQINGETEGRVDEEAAKSAFMDAWQFAKDLDVMNPHRLALEFSVADHFLNFYHAPVIAFNAVDRALNVPAFTESEKRPTFSLLSFEGGFQLAANLINMKRNLLSQNQLIVFSAGPSNIPASYVGRYR